MLALDALLGRLNSALANTHDAHERKRIKAEIAAAKRTRAAVQADRDGRTTVVVDDDDDDEITCPECGAENDPDAEYCKACGEPLGGDDDEAHAPPQDRAAATLGALRDAVARAPDAARRAPSAPAPAPAPKLSFASLTGAARADARARERGAAAATALSGMSTALANRDYSPEERAYGIPVGPKPAGRK